MFYIPNDITNLCQDTLYYSTAYYSIDEKLKRYTNEYKLLNFGFQTKETASKKFVYICNFCNCDIKVKEGVFSFSGSGISLPPLCLACIVEDFSKIETPEPILLSNKDNFK